MRYIILFLLLLPFATAHGIAPASTEWEFSPGQTREGSLTIVREAGEPLEYSLEPYGLEIELPTRISFESDETVRTIRFSALLPKNPPDKAGIRVAQLADDNTGLAGKISLTHTINILAARLRAEVSVRPGRMLAKITNHGEPQELEISVEVLDNRSIVGKTKTRHWIEREKQLELRLPPLPPGEYEAVLRTQGKEVATEAKSTLVEGMPQITLAGVSDDAIILQTNWNREVQATNLVYTAYEGSKITAQTALGEVGLHPKKQVRLDVPKTGKFRLTGLVQGEKFELTHSTRPFSFKYLEELAVVVMLIGIILLGFATLLRRKK